MTVYVKVAVALALACCSTVAVAEDLTLQDVIALTEMQLGDAAIIAKIEAESASFDLSTEQMIELKRKGVSSNVIAAMVRSGKADTEAPRVFWRLFRLSHATISRVSTVA